MNIKREDSKEIFYFILIMLLYKSFYLFICISIYYTNASTPIEQVMEKLIQLISNEQVN